MITWFGCHVIEPGAAADQVGMPVAVGQEVVAAAREEAVAGVGRRAREAFEDVVGDDVVTRASVDGVMAAAQGNLVVAAAGADEVIAVAILEAPLDVGAA